MGSSSRRPLKDVDSVGRAFLLKSIVWLLPASIVFTIMITVAGRLLGGMSGGQAFAVGVLLGIGLPFAVYGIIYFFGIEGAASLLGRLYGAGTTGTPSPPSYWRAQALSARGAHFEAVGALEAEMEADPGDPGPCLRAAALCLGELDDPRSAVDWYLRARNADRITAETDAYVSFVLADVYEKLGDEPRAMVELRRLLELHPGSPYAQGARGRLAALKPRQNDVMPPPGDTRTQ
jgi:hypothetical protein